MAIDLTALPIRRAVPIPYRLGGTVRGAFGSAQHIARMGDRWSFEFETPPMKVEPDGRLWSVLLDQATREEALVRVHPPGFSAGTPGTPVIDTAVASGRELEIEGLTPGYVIKAGQWLNYIPYTLSGTGMLDKVVSQVTANGAGKATVTLLNLIRHSLAAGDPVELADPVIRGTIDGDFGGAWESNRLTSFTFTVTEDE